MFDKVDIVENMVFGKVRFFNNADIVDNDAADELAVKDDNFEDIGNNDTADELDLDDFDDVKKMFDNDDNVENKYLILDKIDIVEKLFLDKDFDDVETVTQKELETGFGGLTPLPSISSVKYTHFIFQINHFVKMSILKKIFLLSFSNWPFEKLTFEKTDTPDFLDGKKLSHFLDGEADLEMN